MQTRPERAGFGGLAWLTTVLAAACIIVALSLLWRAETGIETERSWLGATPVTIFKPDSGLRRMFAQHWQEDRLGGLPVVLIAHGFAGSQQLMQAYAITLARNGYLVVSFDFYGHGRNLEPLSGDVMDIEGATRSLLEQTAAVADFALALPDAAPDLALLGHSMASDIIVRQASADPRVKATVAVSMFSPAVTADSPRNLLMIVGNLEGYLKREALRVIGLVSDESAAGRSFGSFADGSARRAVFAPWVEHVGVLYSPTALRESVAWLDQVFGRQPAANSGFVDSRGLALPLLLAGLVLLAWPLARLLPRLVEPARGLNPNWRQLLPAAIVPALATPLLLMAFPADFMGMLVGGYLAVHFALYGLITAGFCLYLQRSAGRGQTGTRQRGPLLVLLTALAAVLYGAGAIALAMDQFITSFAVTTPRLPLLALMLGGTLAYFLADEWLTRGPQVPRGAHLLTRLCFLLSLGLAVALSFEDLFFLLIIAAVIVPYFLLYGLISGWVYRATGDPLLSALPSAVAFGWALAVVFPQLAA